MFKKLSSSIWINLTFRFWTNKYIYLYLGRRINLGRSV